MSLRSQRLARFPGNDTGPSPEVEAIVLARDRYRCAICSRDLSAGWGLGWSKQHRVARGAGGTVREDINQAAALFLVCGGGATGCHGPRIEQDRTNARGKGWIIPRNAVNVDITKVPAFLPLHGGWVLLDNDGGILRVAPPPDGVEPWELGRTGQA